MPYFVPIDLGKPKYFLTDTSDIGVNRMDRKLRKVLTLSTEVSVVLLGAFFLTLVA